MKKKSGEVMLASLEAEYQSLLIAALERCAAGHWGMFGQADLAHATLGKYAREKLKSKDAEELLELGSSIKTLRHKLGYFEPFALHDRLLKIRSSHGANTPGEAKLARAWLEELQQNPKA